MVKSVVRSTKVNEFCALIQFTIKFEDSHKVPFNSILCCSINNDQKIEKWQNHLSVSVIHANPSKVNDRLKYGEFRQF